MISSDDINFMNTARSIAGWGNSCSCIGQERTLPQGKCGKRFSKWLKNVDAIIDHKYIYNNIGLNVKPLEIQGAVGRIQLNKFAEIKQKRMENYYSMVDIFLNKFYNDLKIVEVHKKAEPCFFAVPFICHNKEFKEKLVAHLEKNNVQTRSYFSGNILLHAAYEHLGDYKDYPNANKVLTHSFFIGCPPHYDQIIFDRIEKIIKEF